MHRINRLHCKKCNVRASDFLGTIMGAAILSCDGMVASFMFVYSCWS